MHFITNCQHAVAKKMHETWELKLLQEEYEEPNNKVK